MEGRAHSLPVSWSLFLETYNIVFSWVIMVERESLPKMGYDNQTNPFGTCKFTCLWVCLFLPCNITLTENVQDGVKCEVNKNNLNHIATKWRILVRLFKDEKWTPLKRIYGLGAFYLSIWIANVNLSEIEKILVSWLLNFKHIPTPLSFEFFKLRKRGFWIMLSIYIIFIGRCTKFVCR